MRDLNFVFFIHFPVSYLKGNEFLHFFDDLYIFSCIFFLLLFPAFSVFNSFSDNLVMTDFVYSVLIFFVSSEMSLHDF